MYESRARAATPTTAPIVIPAIAPFDSSLFPVADLEGEDARAEVEDGGEDVVAGAVSDVGVAVDAVGDVDVCVTISSQARINKQLDVQ
jgi:hypothetical protein